MNSNVGGTGVFYKNLCEELVKKNIETSVFLISKKNYETVENGVRIHCIKDVFKNNPILEMMRSITGKLAFFEKIHFKIYNLEKKIIQSKISKWIKINNFEFDVVETHDFDGLAIAIPETLPYVIRSHGSWTILMKYFGYKKVHKGRVFSEREAFKNSKNNITISKYNDKINKALFQLDNTRLIYNGIDENFFKPNFIKSIIPQSIFYLGNVSFEKGAETLIKNFLITKNLYPNSTLHFVGNPNDYEDYVHQNIKDTNVSKSIIFHGNSTKEQIVNLLNKADVVCFPSMGENFSLSLLEVMAMQKPVICSNIESFTEIIQDSVNGMIVNDNNFHEKICLLFENSTLKNNIALNARKLIDKEFTIEKLVKETIKFYKEVI